MIYEHLPDEGTIGDRRFRGSRFGSPNEAFERRIGVPLLLLSREVAVGQLAGNRVAKLAR